MSSPSSTPARSATTPSPASKYRARRAATSCGRVTGGTPTDLFDPDPERPWVGTVVDLPGEVVRAEADTVAAYLFDTVHLSEQLLLTGGLRWERYKSEFDPAPSQITADRPADRADGSTT